MTTAIRIPAACLAGLALAGCQCRPEPGPVNNNQRTTTAGDSGTPVDSVPAPPCAVPEQEPNDSVAEANALPLELKGCGVFAAPGDFDVFATEVDEEGWLAVGAVAKRIGSFADVQMVLTPPTGSAAIRVDDEGTTDASLLFPSTVGTWTIQLAEQNFNGGDNYFYEVIASIAKAPVEWTASEVEPNDDLATAMPVAPGDAVFGDMGGNLDGDWFRIDVPPGKHELVVDVTAYAEGSAGDFVLYLSDAGGNLLPMGCNPSTTCATRGDPVDPALHDPVLSWTSDGNEQLFVKIAEEGFQWGRHTWYVIAFSLEST